MRKIVKAAAVMAVAGGIALGGTSQAMAAGYHFSGVDYSGGTAVYKYTGAGLPNAYVGSYYGSSWNGSTTARTYVYYLPY